MSHNNHRAALAILEKPELINKDQLIWWLAQTHPAVLLAGCKLTSSTPAPVPSTSVLLLSLHDDRDKLNPIKGIREMVLGLGLKEAKDIVDLVGMGTPTTLVFNREVTRRDVITLQQWFAIDQNPSR